MLASLPATCDAVASRLADMVSAGRHFGTPEVAGLGGSCASRGQGVGRENSLALAGPALEEGGLVPTPFPFPFTGPFQSQRLHDRSRLLALRLAAGDPAPGQLPCRLCAAVITAKGRVTSFKGLVCASILSEWGATETRLAHAIMQDREHW